MPCQADCNRLKVDDDCPEVLKLLVRLEARLLAQRYPYMKLLALPRSKQNAIKGSMVNVPVNIEKVASSLPHTPTQAAQLYH